ncbi:hypothetical protein [Agaribacterium sp. ZY112]|uniref:hypothetical protein n=1 Tax=Agaribacterium sp. ZY112 TaxID=3233574 RepID=UPI003526368A
MIRILNASLISGLSFAFLFSLANMIRLGNWYEIYQPLHLMLMFWLFLFGTIIALVFMFSFVPAFNRSSFTISALLFVSVGAVLGALFPYLAINILLPREEPEFAASMTLVDHLVWYLAYCFVGAGSAFSGWVYLYKKGRINA